MKLDRALQLKILEFLSDHYAGLAMEVFPEEGMTADLHDRYVFNMLYLQAHDLIDAGLHQSLDGTWDTSGAQITAAGLDFLAADGGLSAILGVVTIKLHDDTIRQLIEARIQSAELPETTKSHLLKSLREAPGETIKHLTEKLLDAGLENWPTALVAIQKFL